MPADWTPRDLQLLARHGLSVDEVERQLQLFARPPHYLRLDRACTVGDGVRKLDAAAQSACVQAYEAARDAGRILKFVPASGAASRMFALLLAAFHDGGSLRLSDLQSRHDDSAAEVLRFAAALPRFAFYPLLRQSMQAHGLDLEALRRTDLRPVLAHLLTDPIARRGSMRRWRGYLSRRSDSVGRRGIGAYNLYLHLILYYKASRKIRWSAI